MTKTSLLRYVEIENVMGNAQECAMPLWHCHILPLFPSKLHNTFMSLVYKISVMFLINTDVATP